MAGKPYTFSLIRIFIAVAIVAPVLTILRPSETKNPEKTTRVLLATLQRMLAEFEKRGGQTTTLTDPYSELGNREMMPIGAAGENAVSSSPQLAAAIERTRIVMHAIVSIPENSSVLDKLPPEVFMKEPGTDHFAKGPILLDAWNRPILFAPGRTLTGVGVNKWGVSKPDGSSFQSPDGKGIFISAGEDGDYSTGAANLYSFEK